MADTCELVKEKVKYTATQTIIDSEYLVSSDDSVEVSDLIDLTSTPSGTSVRHPQVTSAFITEIGENEYIEGTSDPYQYKYLVHWETATPSMPSPPNADPEDDLPGIDWGGSDDMETIYFDIDNDPIETTAKQAYKNQPQREAGQGAVVITRNETTNNAALWNQYSFSLNNATWNGNTAYQGKMGRITARNNNFRNGVHYWKVSYPIIFKREGWRLLLEQWGDCELGADGKPVACLDEKGLPITVPLDEDGHRQLLTDTRVVKTHKIYSEQDWSTLDLPNPFA